MLKQQYELTSSDLITDEGVRYWSNRLEFHDLEGGEDEIVLSL